MKPFSLDLRRRILAAVERGELTLRQIAHHFSVSLSCVVRLLQRYRRTGSLAPDPRGGGHPSKLDDAAVVRLLELVREQPDATLAELRDRLGIPCSVTTIFRALKRHRITRNQKALREPVRDTPRVRDQRREFRAEMAREDAGRLIFFDEMGANTAMAGARGRCPRGRRVVGRVPARGANRTLAVCLGLSGVAAPVVKPWKHPGPRGVP